MKKNFLLLAGLTVFLTAHAQKAVTIKDLHKPFEQTTIIYKKGTVGYFFSHNSEASQSLTAKEKAFIKRSGNDAIETFKSTYCGKDSYSRAVLERDVDFYKICRLLGKPIIISPTIKANGPVTFNEGGNVTLSTNSPSANQWYKNDAAVNNATGKTLLVTAAGTYKVKTHAPGFAANVFSNIIDVSVNAGQPLPAIDQTVVYAQAPGNTQLLVKIQTPVNIAAGNKRPLIIFTHGTGEGEVNNLQPSEYTSEFLNQGFIVANFNFYGSNSTRTRDDGNHLTAQYSMLVDYLVAHANEYHINTDAIISTGISGSSANAIDVALRKNLFGCFMMCSGRNVGLMGREPASLNRIIAIGGVQTRSDGGFGDYRYTGEDVAAGRTHTPDYSQEITTNAKINPPGDCKYCTAWNDCGLEETTKYYTAKYGTKINAKPAYSVIIENSAAHCSGGAAWHNAVKTIPRQMLNEAGINW